MRNIDLDSKKLKAQKTINFDKDVLRELEKKAKEQRTTTSTLANFLIRKALLSDITYYRDIAKYHYIKFQEYKYLVDQLENQSQRKIKIEKVNKVILQEKLPMATNP